LQQLSQQILLASMLDLGTAWLRLQRSRYSHDVCIYIDATINTTGSGAFLQEISDQLQLLLFVRGSDVQDVVEPTLLEVGQGALRHRGQQC